MAGLCRICVVEVEGQRTLQAACAYPITQPLTINTHSRAVRVARRHVLDLLLSEHYGDCYSCVRNGNCELQSLAEEYGVDKFRFGHPEHSMFPVDDSSYSVVRDMDKCIRCRRCVRTCIDLQEVGVYEAINRSNQTEIATFLDKPLANVVCINCGQCINRCPPCPARQGRDRGSLEGPRRPHKARGHPDRAGTARRHGRVLRLEPGTPVTFEMNTALKRIGFNHVFDTNFTADLTIIEEGTELILRLYKALVQKDESVALPQFTSCSPGWVKYLEHFYPEYIPNASSAKSPQQDVRGAHQDVLRREAWAGPGQHRELRAHALLGQEVRVQPARDARLRLQGRRLRHHHARARQDVQGDGIDVPSMPKSDFDDPFGTATGSGVIFGATAASWSRRCAR